jgi:hypothetical protein
MAINWSSAAAQYCLWKAYITTAVAGVVAVLLLVLAFLVPRWMGDTSKYVAAEAVVVQGGSVAPVTTTDGHGGRTTAYTLSYRVSYTAGGKSFQSSMSSSTTYPDAASAGEALAASTGTTKRIFYDPSDPRKIAQVRNLENWVSAGLVTLGVVIAICAAVGFLLRKNAIFCGMGIASNAS